jgi:two-component system, OmpR family, sensor histidine kinase BaeS
MDPGRHGRRRPGPRGGHRAAGGAGFFGCLLLALVLVTGLVAALATWVAAAFLGLVAPDATPSALTAVAVLVVIAIAILAGIRVFGGAVRPLAEIASAAERLGDGDPGVRVRVRGPRPVRGLATSFNAMAERLDRSRDDRRTMLADVTHELGTPLTVVAGGLEAMLDGVHPMDEDHVAPLLAETEVMGRLLDDLRTLSLAEAGALTLHREPADLAAIASEVVAAQRPMAVTKGLTVDTAGDVRLVATVDPVRIREVVANLVANALRHTPRGGTVTVSVHGGDAEAVIEVRDTGEGIPPDDLERVFDRFHRDTDTGGSGLGLAIVRDLVAAHGGTVEARSTGVPGEGATFLVRIPLRP